MIVTLKEIMEKNTRDYNINKLKSFLYHVKMKGYIFFEQTIFELEENTKFHLYYCKRPGLNSEINAFPIPRNKLQEREWFTPQILKPYFEVYYNGQGEHEMFFEKYADTAPFVADEFIWIYRKFTEYEKWIIN